jgi:hypothetical protein
VDADQVADLARQLCEAYSWEALDPGVSEPTLKKAEDGYAIVVLPRDQEEEPFRSLKLIDAVALGPVLMVAFTWADGQDDETVYLMPLDMRDVTVNMHDEIAVSAFLMRHIEFSLGGPRDSWESARGATLSPHLVLVRSCVAAEPDGPDAAERGAAVEYERPPGEAQWFVKDYGYLVQPPDDAADD